MRPFHDAAAASKGRLQPQRHCRGAFMVGRSSPWAACSDRWPYVEPQPRLEAVLAILCALAASSSLLACGALGSTPSPATCLPPVLPFPHPPPASSPPSPCFHHPSSLSLAPPLHPSSRAPPPVCCPTQTCCGWDRLPHGGSWWARHTRMFWLASLQCSRACMRNELYKRSTYTAFDGVGCSMCPS